MDGGHRVALHARVLRRGAGPARARRRAVPVGAHLRHQRRRPAVDRRHVRVGVPRRHAVAGRRRRRPAGRRDRAAGAAGRGAGRASGPPGRGRRRPGRRGRSRPVQPRLAARGRRAGPRPLRRRCAGADRRLRPGGVRGPAHRVLAGAAPTTRRRCGRWPPSSRCPAVDAARAAAGAAAWRDRGWMLLEASAPRAAWADFEPRLRRDPRDRAGLRGAGPGRRRRQPADETVALLRELAAPPDRVEAQLALSRFLASTGDVQEAAGRGVRGRRAAPVRRRRPGTAGLGALRRRATSERLLPVVARLRAVAPDRRRHALLHGVAALPRRAHRSGDRRGPGARRRQPDAMPAATTCSAPRSPRRVSARRPATRSSHRSRSNRATRRPTRTSACSNSRPATAPPACSAWPRR